MSTACRVWGILQRANSGPHMEEDDFLPKRFTPTLKKLIKHYEITYDVATALPTQEHYDLLRKIKDELAAMGINFLY